MGKALVIKGTNFSANKLTTVNLNDPKPCTAISLDKSSYAFTSVGATLSLTATLTPVDTTDVVEWSTSASNVATVANGVVTCTGIGSATITATCGTQTATCTISATNVLEFDHIIGEDVTKGTGERDYAEINPQSAHYAGLFSTDVSTALKIRKASSSTVPATNVYPIMLGNNATTINATVPSSIKISVWFLSSATPAEYSGGSYAQFAKVISGDASPWDSSITAGDRVMTVPNGADSVVFSLYYSSGDITAEDIENITITVS